MAIVHSKSICYNTPGVKKIIAEIERILKPGGGVYLSFSSKDSKEYVEKSWQQMDENTLICPYEVEKGIPHFYACLSDINELLANFTIENISHTGHSRTSGQMFYYVNARMK